MCVELYIVIHLSFSLTMTTPLTYLLTISIPYLEDCYGNRLPVATGYFRDHVTVAMSGASGERGA